MVSICFEFNFSFEFSFSFLLFLLLLLLSIEFSDFVVVVDVGDAVADASNTEAKLPLFFVILRLEMNELVLLVVSKSLAK